MEENKILDNNLNNSNVNSDNIIDNNQNSPEVINNIVDSQVATPTHTIEEAKQEEIIEIPVSNVQETVTTQNNNTPEIKEVPPVQNENVQNNNNSNQVVTSGTATEEEIIIDASTPEAEVLDEYEIKKDVADEEKRFKHNIIFIGIVVLLIIIFIILMPYIVKRIAL